MIYPLLKMESWSSLLLFCCLFLLSDIFYLLYIFKCTKTFSRINHILDQKSSLNKFNIEVTSIILSAHYSMKLEINKRRKAGKLKNMWKLNYKLLNNQWVKEESKREIKNILRQMKMKTQHTPTQHTTEYQKQC